MNGRKNGILECWNNGKSKVKSSISRPLPLVARATENRREPQRKAACSRFKVGLDRQGGKRACPFAGRSPFALKAVAFRLPASQGF